MTGFAGRAVIYCRISDDREGEAVGVARQEKDCRELAARLNLEVVDVKIDNDIGASTRTKASKIRYEYAEMIAKARTGAYSHILAYSNSRITRRLSELEELIRLHEETEAEFGKGKGVVIHTYVSGNDDLSTADGRMVARIKASVDVAEAERISERIKSANRHKALKGEPGLQRRRPFGFELDAITHNPQEAALIREAVQELLMGASITSIRRKWEKAGVLTSDGNSEWSWTAVRRVLLSWRTVGVRELNGEPLEVDGEFVKGVWDPIISIEDREACLEALQKRTRKGTRQGKWLLQGMLRCGICGSPLYGALMKPPRTNSYSCTATGNTHLAISAQKIEDYLRRVVYRYILEKTIRVDAEATDATDEPWPDEDRLASVSSRISELMEAFNNDVLSGSIVFPQVQELDQQRRQLQKERTSFHAQQKKAPKLITQRDDALKRYRRMHDQSFEDSQLALRQEIDSVVIHSGVRGYAGRSHAELKKRVTINWLEPHYEFDGISAEEWADRPILKIDVPGERPWGASLTDDEQDGFDKLADLGSKFPTT